MNWRAWSRSAAKRVDGTCLERHPLACRQNSKHALLIFDNCEHLSDAAGRLVEALLVEAPGIHVLATSRKPLGILGERIYRVASLALPPDEKPISAAGALAYDGVRFFVTRAEEASSFVLEDHNAATVVHIARRLDGIALAIELATARLRAMTVHQLSERLDASFRVLTARAAAARDRRTLREFRRRRDGPHDAANIYPRIQQRHRAFARCRCE
jgi:predicted ATPase